MGRLSSVCWGVPDSTDLKALFMLEPTSRGQADCKTVRVTTLAMPEPPSDLAVEQFPYKHIDPSRIRHCARMCVRVLTTLNVSFRTLFLESAPRVIGRAHLHESRGVSLCSACKLRVDSERICPCLS